MLGLLRARKTPVCRHVLGSPADLSPTVFPGFRREARLTPGYARTAFQAEEERRPKDAPAFTRREFHHHPTEPKVAGSNPVGCIELRRLAKKVWPGIRSHFFVAASGLLPPFWQIC